MQTQHTADAPVRASAPSRSTNPLIYPIIGVAVWLLGTVAVRLFGHVLFNPDTPAVTTALFLINAPAMSGLMLLIYRRFEVAPHNRAWVTLWMAAPSVLLDVPSVLFSADVFPNLAPSMRSVFGAWLLWSYAFVLLPAFRARWAFFTAWGVVLWVAGVVFIRLVAHNLLIAGSPALWLTFAAAIPATAFITYPVYRWRKVSAQDRAAATVALALPIFLGDGLETLLAATFYPNLPATSYVYLAAILMWFTALGLLTAFGRRV